MPGESTRVSLLRTTRAGVTVMPVVSTGGSLASGSGMAATPVVGVGVMVMLPAEYPPTRRIGAPFVMVSEPPLPFVLSAPPCAAVHLELTCIVAWRTTVGPPDSRTGGHPRRPFGQLWLPGSSCTIE